MITILLRRKLDTVIDVEVPRPLLEGNSHLPPRHVVLVAIDDSPDILIAERPAAGVDSIHVRRIKRFPALTHQEWSDAALHCRRAARRFGIAWRDPVPDAPHILPTLPAFAVKEGILKIVCLVSIP